MENAKILLGIIQNENSCDGISSQQVAQKWGLL